LITITPGSHIVDTDYILKFDSPRLGEFFFRGFSGLSYIIYEVKEQMWSLLSYKDINNKTTLLGYLNETGDHPIGLHDWHLRTVCDRVSEEFKIHQLKLSTVSILTL